MGVREQLFNQNGQMTLELAVTLPVILVVCLIGVNALTFFGDCVVFDRVVRESVRVHATAPAHGQSAQQSCALVEQAIAMQMNAPNLSFSVERGSADIDLDAYTATLEYQPTLFGLELRSEVFGVQLMTLTHRTRYVVDSYKAGVVI